MAPSHDSEAPATGIPIIQASDAEEVTEGAAYFSAPSGTTGLADYMPSTSLPGGLSDTDIEKPENPADEGPSTPRPVVRKPAPPPNPDTFAEAVFLDYGVVVFFGLDESQERSILEDVQGAGVMEKPIKESRWEIEECHYEVRLWSSSCNRRVLRPRSTTHILPIPAFTTTFSVGFPPNTLQARSDIMHSFQIQFPSPHHLRGARTRAVNPPGAL